MDLLIKKIDIDTLGYADEAAPDYGSITAMVGGRKVTLRLDQEQTERLVSIAASLAADILSEIANQEPVAA